MENTKYDYIIAGAGAGGLSLLCYLLSEKCLSKKSILVIDKDLKQQNDRTWCFWQKEDSPFEKCIQMQWKQLTFHSPDYSSIIDISPFKYKMLDSILFYEHSFELIKRHDNVFFQQDRIESLDANGMVVCENATYYATYVFNSVFRNPLESKHAHNLIQHFKGHFIETQKPSFDTKKPVLMDFRVEQHEDCRFVYVLPISQYKALIEYTGFSKKPLTDDKYNFELHSYIKNYLNVDSYHITHTESGIIPMTSATFPSGQGAIVNIGTAGGATKASTGYTFSFIQKQCQEIVRNLNSGKSPLTSNRSGINRFTTYDRIFLRVLIERKRPSWLIFNDLFKNLPASLILSFLAEETNMLEELRLGNVMNKPTFMAAAFREILS